MNTQAQIALGRSLNPARKKDIWPLDRMDLQEIKERKMPRWNMLAGLENCGRITSAEELCTNSEKCGIQIDQGNEPYILLPDQFNPGEFQPMPVYDNRQGLVQGMCCLEVHAGSALVERDTLIYWK